MTDLDSEENAKKLIDDADFALETGQSLHRNALLAAVAAEEAAQKAVTAVMVLLLLHTQGSVSNDDLKNAFSEAEKAVDAAAISRQWANSTNTTGVQLLRDLAKVALKRGDVERAESLAGKAIKAETNVATNYQRAVRARDNAVSHSSEVEKILKKD
jgi:hypothetical protein